MSDVLVRGLSAKVVDRLKDRAKRNGRSLQGEAKTILEGAAGAGKESVAKIFDKWQKRFAGRKFSSSTQIIRRDRRK